MSGSVIPISPAPEMQGASVEKPPSVNRGATDNSHYESISRLEQQRLERRDAAHAASRTRQDQRTEDRRTADQENAKTSGSGPSPGAARKEEAAAKGTSASQDDNADTDSARLTGSEESLLEAPATDAGAVFTFADLQALVSESENQPLMTTQGVMPGRSGQPGQSPFASTLMAGMFEGMTGGKGNSAPGLGKSPSESTLKLMESLVGQLSAEAGKSADPGLAVSSRFQGTLDLAGQSLTAASGQKPLDAGIPLRSYTTSVELPVGHAEWGDKLMGKLAWLTSQNMSMAEIHLTPPDMGPMEVRVQVQNEQATVTVHTSNSAVRDQLELHSHRLRDMLGAQGLGLESFDVSDSSTRSDQEQAGDQSDDVSGDGVSSVLDDNEPGEVQGVLDLSWKGELDIYA